MEGELQVQLLTAVTTVLALSPHCHKYTNKQPFTLDSHYYLCVQDEGVAFIRLYLVSVFPCYFKKRDSTRAVTSAGERHL